MKGSDMKLMTCLLPASLGAAVIGLAATVNAEPANKDAAFLTSLQQAGISYSNPADVVAAAYGVCGAVNEGVKGIEVANELAKRNPGFTLDGAAVFTRLAADAYCPHHLV
jgi:hypothetical protein